jgi:AcrR family transcriptional regulator
MAALELVDSGGADAFTLRSLAHQLGSSTATLYRHFSGKEEILVLVVEHVLSEAREGITEAFTAEPGWQQRIRLYAQALYGALERHPKVVPLLVATVPTGPASLQVRELVLATLLNAGFGPHFAARTYTTISHYIIGFASQLQGDSGAEGDDAQGYLGRLDPADYPATAIVASLLSAALGDEFLLGLDLLIAGIANSPFDPADSAWPSHVP